MKIAATRSILCVSSCAAIAVAAIANERPEPAMSAADLARNRPVAPFRIADNLYYVGTSDIAVYLFAAREGLILLDGGYPASAPMVLASVRHLGFDPKQIRILIASQAHFDHVGGLAAIKAASGARLYASPADAELLERGGRRDFAFGDRLTYPPVKVDHRLRDEEVVSLGPIRLTAHFTPGHTKGCTSWTMDAVENGRAIPALFVCGATAPGYRLVGNKAYPNILADFASSFDTWRRLPCSLFLGGHGSYFGLAAKRAAMNRGPGNPFVDPAGCRAFLDQAERELGAEAARERNLPLPEGRPR